MSLFLAIGKGKEGGFLSISRQGLFFVPAILIMPRLFGLEGIIWAQPAADLLTVILTVLLALGINKKLKILKQSGVQPVELSQTKEENRNAV